MNWAAVKLFLGNLPWKQIIIVFAVIAAFGGTWFHGYKTGDHRADVRIAEYEEQMREKSDKVEAGQAKIDTKTIVKWRTKVERIEVEKEHRDSLIENNVKEVGNLPAGWVYVHNLAATGGMGDQKKAADATDSQVDTRKALATVTANYDSCRKDIERFEALQSWIRDTEKNVEASNGKKSK
jgi:hypothetical protein